VLGDPDSMTDDHQVGAAGVTGHDGGVVDGQLGAGVGFCRWYTRGLDEALS
jgi:hypothetical protein